MSYNSKPFLRRFLESALFGATVLVVGSAIFAAVTIAAFIASQLLGPLSGVVTLFAAFVIGLALFITILEGSRERH